MAQIQKILCPVDFSPASIEALRYSIDLAKGHNARLYLMHVIAPVIPIMPDLYVSTETLISAFEKRAETEIEDLKKTALRAGVTVQAEVHRGDVELEIDDAVKKGEADLVVMGKHGRPAFKRWFMGSTTDRLLRRLHVPMIIVGEGKAQEGIKRIVVATDFSQGAMDAVSYAAALAKESGAALTVLHVMSHRTQAVGIPYEEPVAEVQAELDKLTSKEAWIATQVESGVPYQTILSFVENSKADLLVMNIHGKSGLERALLGSTAERVIRGAPCPVLAVPPKEM